MGKNVMFSVLCGMLCAKGRDEALLDHGTEEVRQAFSRMMPKSDAIDAYFEVPLIGKRGIDVICSLGKPVRKEQVPEAVDGAWSAALAWFSDIATMKTEKGNVQLLAEMDLVSGMASRLGTYLIQCDRADLVGPYLAVVGEAAWLSAWESFCTRLPRGWETTYVGLFPGRGDNLLRVNAHPAHDGAVGFTEALSHLGLAANEEAIALCRSVLDSSSGFDLQLDVDDGGRPVADFALEARLEGKLLSMSPWEDGRAQRVFSLMEESGAADGRWSTLEQVDISKQLLLPTPDGLQTCSMSLRTYSAKVRFTSGRPALAKAYLRGEALLSDNA